MINTYVKDVGEKKNNEILKINSDNIFIPEDTTFNELYIQKLNDQYINLKNKNITFNIKYINILPYGDTIVSKNGLWNLLKKKYSRKYLYKYFPKTFILQNFYCSCPKSSPGLVLLISNKIDRQKICNNIPWNL